MKKIALIGLGATAMLALPGVATAGTQSFSQPTVSANPTAGAPVTLTETGTSDPGSTLTVSAQAGGGACTAAAVQIDSAAVAGTFTHATVFTPAQPGVYTICYFFSGANGTQSSSFAISVAPAPPPPAGPVPVATRPNCVVPNLLRHSEAYAQHLLTKANCKLGRVYRPSQRTLSRAKRRAGGRAPKLVVASQTPRKAGTVSYDGAVVAIRLGIAPRPKPAAKRG
ncbi:MAG TPA: hypothetical protein VHW26_03115 [Solirubrobacteraceae bacterium]|jgi:hypothetical protein|nr:hypothetical protein [Solirubrobacteraceae bacterium]